MNNNLNLFADSSSSADVLLTSAVSPELPPPETWAWELDYLINRLCDRLDICKSYGVLLDSCVSKERQLPQRHECLRFGACTLAKYLNQKFPTKAADEKHQHTILSEFQTPTLAVLTQSCCLDDANLGYIFDLLRLAEFVEDAINPLDLESRAETVCAIIGELEIVSRDLSAGLQKKTEHDIRTDDSSSTDVPLCANYVAVTAKTHSLEFIKATQRMLLDIIAECGRDRATFMKELYSHLPIPPPRPIFYEKKPLSIHGLGYGINQPLYSSLPGYQKPQHARSDPFLQHLLLAGSLQSIWKRLHQLWGSMTEHYGSATDFIIEEKIRWAVTNAVRCMSRYRQLLFTRLLEILAAPTFMAPQQSSLEAVNFNTSPPKLVQLVFDAFIEAGVAKWPYESEEQLNAIQRSSHLSLATKERLRLIIQIPDSIHFLIHDDLYVSCSKPSYDLIFQQCCSPSKNIFEKTSHLGMGPPSPKSLRLSHHKSHKKKNQRSFNTALPCFRSFPAPNEKPAASEYWRISNIV